MPWMLPWTARPNPPLPLPPRPRPLPSRDDEDAPPRGCAWFDSSADLMRGLVVVELPLTLGVPLDQSASA
jgi:hypothetical protein